jgi:hypothetical protein
MWPVGRGIRRYGLSDYLFAKSPWAVVRGAVESHASTSRVREASAFLDQAQSFFDAAQSREPSFTPLLFYYSFINLAKAFILAKGLATSLDRARDGLMDGRGAGTTELDAAQVVVKNPSGDINIFPLLARALGHSLPAHNKAFPVTELMPQVVVGHRLWREAGKKERFVALDRIEFFHDVPEGPGHAWLRLHVARGDLTRYGITQTRFLNEGKLNGLFQRVKAGGDDQLCFEQVTATPYSHRAADVLKNVVDVVRSTLWRSATSMPPYRHYYIHLTAPPADYRLPQLLSLYMLFFYFGSVTRYRPHVYGEILSGPYGPFVNEFMASQPDQLLYLLASEICEREVAKPALI